MEKKTCITRGICIIPCHSLSPLSFSLDNDDEDDKMISFVSRDVSYYALERDQHKNY